MAADGPADPSPSSHTPSGSDRPDRPGGSALDEGPERGGEGVVLVLFLILALCVVAVFTVFGAFSPDVVREEIPFLIARNLYIPVVATSILVAIDAKRRDRSGWWVYLVTAPVPLVNVGLALAWLLKWRDAPKQVGRWTL